MTHDAEGARLWAVVAATVRPLPGRSAPRPGPAGAPARAGPPVAAPPPGPRHGGAPRPAWGAPGPLEPGRHRRLISGREHAPARIDLHGLSHDDARASLTRFILGAVDEGLRAVLVITGKGTLGDGVLRRRTPEWLGEAPLRVHVAGLSEAHRRHGGSGALYVALRRRERR